MQSETKDKVVRPAPPVLMQSGQVEELVHALDILAEPVLISHRDTPLYANEALLEMLGYDGSVADFLAIPIECWVHIDDIPKVREAFSARFDDAKKEEVDFRIICMDGDVKQVNARARLVSWQDKPAVVTCLRDISPLPSEILTSQSSDNLFRSIFRMSPELMAVSNLKDGRFIDVNPAFLNAFGRRREDVIGKSSDELGIWADPTFLNRFAEEFKMTASMMDVPATVRIRGGIIRHFRLFAQKIDYGSQSVLLMIGRDVTDDMVQSQELQRSRDTAELANRAKSEFLANMSHELRTPLNAILGFAEIIRDEMLGAVGQPRYKEYAADIHNSGSHLLTIINDILDLSKVEAGRLEAHLRWTDPLPALEMCLSLVQHRASEAGLTLTHDLVRDFEIEADERLIKQIGLNLLSNAIKFTEDGGQIRLSLAVTSDEGLCLAVEDTGIGMTPEEIRIAKRPFGQVDSSMARRHQGSGLGLPLVAAFADRLGAAMRIVSTPGRGTRVGIYFPSHKVRPIAAECTCGTTSELGDI